MIMTDRLDDLRTIHGELSVDVDEVADLEQQLKMVRSPEDRREILRTSGSSLAWQLLGTRDPNPLGKVTRHLEQLIRRIERVRLEIATLVEPCSTTVAGYLRFQGRPRWQFRGGKPPREAL